MAFDEEKDKEPVKKIGLKNVSSKKSIFDDLPKKPSAEEFDKKVQDIEGQKNQYKIRAADLTKQWVNIIQDKTLKENKSILTKDIEKEVFNKMILLAEEINNDPNENEGSGSLNWIALLLKLELNQRDRANKLEYELSLIKQKLDTLIK